MKTAKLKSRPFFAQEEMTGHMYVYIYKKKYIHMHTLRYTEMDISHVSRTEIIFAYLFAKYDSTHSAE